MGIRICGFCFGLFVSLLVYFQALPSSLALLDVPGLSYTFSAPVLESAISPRSPVSNKNWRIVLETKIWVLSVLIAGSW